MLNNRLNNLKEFLCSSDKIVRFEIKQSRTNKYWGLTLYIKPIMGVGGQTWLKEDIEVYNFPITIMFDNRILISQTDVAELEEICASSINKNSGRYENTFNIGLGLIPRVTFSELHNHNNEIVFDDESNIFIDLDSLKIIKDGNEEYLYKTGDVITMQYSELLDKLIDNIVYLKQSQYMLSLDFYERSDTQDDIDFRTHDSNIVKFMSPYFMNNREDN
jgi:ABC-type antimicrobial peptide transport system permease subunit